MKTALPILVLILVWGTTWAAIRVGLEGVPPFTGVAVRFALAGAVLLALSPLFDVRLGKSRIERRLWLVNAFGSFVIAYGIVYWGEQYVPSGLTAVLFATFPLFVAILAHFFLPGERLTVRAGAGVLVGFAGVAVIFSEDLARLSDPWAERTLGGVGPGIFVAASILLIAPAVAAVANVAIKRWGKGIHPLSLTGPPMLLASVCLGAVALVVERDLPVEWTPPAIASLLYLALFGSALNFMIYFRLLDRLPATRLSLFNYAVPVVAVITGALFLQEPVTWRLAAGAGLVIAGCAVALDLGRVWGQGRRTAS